MKNLRSDGTEFNPVGRDNDNKEKTEKQGESRETSDESKRLDQAVFNPEEVVEQEQDFQKAEAVEEAFVEVVESTEMQAEADSEVEMERPSDNSDLKEGEEGELDTLGGISEEMSLRLQIQMERKQKVIQTLSNTIKNISDTSDSIMRNLK